MFSSRLTLLLVIALLSGIAANDSSAQKSEFVEVQKVEGDTAIVVRTNGERYRIEKGVGCPWLDFYEGKQVIISSPGFFLGVGSDLFMPDSSQRCRIWDAKELRRKRREAKAQADSAARKSG